jgi:hypothetical protein
VVLIVISLAAGSLVFAAPREVIKLTLIFPQLALRGGSRMSAFPPLL